MSSINAKTYEPAASAHVAFIGMGVMGYPMAGHLATAGHAVTVYNRAHFYPDRPREYRGMRIAYLPSVQTKSFETITHTLLAVIHAAVRKFDDQVLDLQQAHSASPLSAAWG